MIPLVLPVLIVPNHAAQPIRAELRKQTTPFIHDWLNRGYPVALLPEAHSWARSGNGLVYPEQDAAWRLGREFEAAQDTVDTAAFWQDVDVFLFLQRGFPWGYGYQDGQTGRGYALLGDPFIDALFGVLDSRLEWLRDKLPQGRVENIFTAAASHEVWHALGSPGAGPETGYHTNTEGLDIGFEWWFGSDALLAEQPNRSLIKAAWENRISRGEVNV